MGVAVVRGAGTAPDCFVCRRRTDVGKSSLINSLRRSRVCGVGAAPGFTKVCQEVVLDKHIRLLDSPGVIFDAVDGEEGESPADLILRNAVRLEDLADPIPAVAAILARCSPLVLEERYALYVIPSDTLCELAERSDPPG